ncbi:hypothetical protein CI102_15110 [Trichoderma harzianum]|nr:hypothetical protein CI102_15110 [Trichoderma harzianum]
MYLLQQDAELQLLFVSLSTLSLSIPTSVSRFRLRFTLSATLVSWPGRSQQFLLAAHHIPLAAYPPTLALSQRRRHIDILHSAIPIDLGSEFPSPTISHQLFCIASEASLVVYHHNIDTLAPGSQDFTTHAAPSAHAHL